MSNRYLVTEFTHYINGRLVSPNQGDASIVELPAGVTAGRWLVPLDGQAEAKAELQLFAAKHISRGDYVVERVEDGSRASVVFPYTGTKGEAERLAEAEAARLNAGGELILGEPGNDAAGSASQDLPDA